MRPGAMRPALAVLARATAAAHSARDRRRLPPRHPPPLRRPLPAHRVWRAARHLFALLDVALPGEWAVAPPPERAVADATAPQSRDQARPRPAPKRSVSQPSPACAP